MVAGDTVGADRRLRPRGHPAHRGVTTGYRQERPLLERARSPVAGDLLTRRRRRRSSTGRPALTARAGDARLIAGPRTVSGAVLLVRQVAREQPDPVRDAGGQVTERAGDPPSGEASPHPAAFVSWSPCRARSSPPSPSCP